MTEQSELNLENETKNERFLRLVNYRLPKAVERIRMIGNLGSNNYEYTPDQRDTVIAVLRLEVDKVEAALSGSEHEDDVPTIV